MNLRLATLQRLAIIAVIGLAIAYLVLLRPLARRVIDEEGPMKALLEQLGKATVEAGMPFGSGFGALSNRLEVLRKSSEAFSLAMREAMPRLEQPPELKARIGQPFQLVEFLNESQRRVEELQAQAQAANVSLTPGLARGFPSYRAELARPELLWVQLALVNRAVRTAIRAGVREVREVSVEALPVQETSDFGPFIPSPAPANAGGAGARATLRLHLTTVGGVDAQGRLMLALSLTPDELKAVGFPEDLGERPALFLDQVLMRRNELQEIEQVQLELVVSTVVLEEEP